MQIIGRGKRLLLPAIDSGLVSLSAKVTTIPYWQKKSVSLYLANSFQMLPQMPAASVPMIFADPPYFLSGGGISCSGGKQVSVNKASWDEAVGWKEKHEFNRNWLRECKRVMAKDGSIWVSGTMHNIYSVGLALEQEGFRILNNIIWRKTNPPPNLACRCFTHSTETLLWACHSDKRANHYFNYALMKEINGGKQMKDVWEGSLTPQREKKYGKHPTQKPEYLLERIVLATSRPGDIVLDPFCGSGTTGVAALRHGRQFIGIDTEAVYLNIARQRLEQEK